MKFIVLLAAFVAVAAALQPGQGPVVVEENQEVPELINFPGIHDAEDEPTFVDVPSNPTVNIVINVNSAPSKFEEIEPTPINIVDDLEPEPSPVIVVDQAYDEDFVPDPEVYY